MAELTSKKHLTVSEKSNIFIKKIKEKLMGKLIKYTVFIAICIISAFGIYSLVKTAKTDEHTLE